MRRPINGPYSEEGVAESWIVGVKTRLHRERISRNLDVTDEKSIEQAVKLVQENYGQLDASVNNAAAGSMDPVTKTRLQLRMDTDAVAPAMVVAALRPLLRRAQKPYSSL